MFLYVFCSSATRLHLPVSFYVIHKGDYNALAHVKPVYCACIFFFLLHTALLAVNSDSAWLLTTATWKSLRLVIRLSQVAHLHPLEIISRQPLQAEAWALPHHCSLLGFQEWGSMRGSVFTGSQPGWEGGASGNARGQRGYDKYLLWHTGRENKRKKKKKETVQKVERFNYIWAGLITFLILLTVPLVYPPSLFITAIIIIVAVATCKLLARQ